AWNQTMRDSIHELDSLFREYVSATRGGGDTLAEKDATSRVFAEALRLQRPTTAGPVISHLDALVNDRSWNQLLVVTGRWRDEHLLSTVEDREATRGRVQ